MITQEELKELFSYDPLTGVFTRKMDGRKWKAGSVAGGLNNTGYIAIEINGSSYVAHRLAWIYMSGDIPEGMQIDHINGDRSDNRFDNLRLAKGHGEQAQNRKKRTDNSSGFVGVNWRKRERKWHARICVKGVRHELGFFDTPEEANKVYVKAKIRFHTFNPVQR